ncbi:hypothetical protein [Paraburkholderia sp. HD33-4]|uniref:hypothetical protein n=1 Tax=Paraburkholderia sp. HD33-4 TaxID=2883242 RepID=UPI001F1A64FD|nr:hypothetical protein [Paraburkholderia sp. HD33-4]
MFDLTKQTARVDNLNPKPEMHGAEEVKFIDIKLKADLSNTILDSFSPTLREALFCAGPQPDMHGHLKHLKHPELGVQHWAGEFRPVVLQIHGSGRSAKDDMVFRETRLSKIAFEPKEGGTCAFVWNIRVQPNEADAGRLFGLMHAEVRITQDMSAATTHEGDGDE